jgi:lipopolysaccharide biosynthesis regulator YciM
LLGGIHTFKKELPAAAAEYRAALEIEPDVARVELRLGTVLAAEGDRDGAAAHLRTAAKGNDAAVAGQALEALRELGVR